MTDIILVQPPLHDFYLTVKRTIPYGLLCLASHLRAAGFSVRLMDGLATNKRRPLPLPPGFGFLRPYYPRPDHSPWALFHTYYHYGYHFDHLAHTVKREAPFLVGVSSLFTPYAEQALQTARAIKSVHPNCTIVVGGHHATQQPQAVLAEPAVDFVIRGAGEVAMVSLAQALREIQPDLDRIPGLVYRTGKGQLKIPSPAAWQPEWAQSAPALDLLNQRFYRRYGHGSMVVVASRGCPFKCTYCAVGQGNEPYRRRAVEAVLAEIGQGIEVQGARFIDFEDENLSLDRDWFLTLLDAIINKWSGLGLELRAMNGLYPPSLDAVMIKKMAQAGFKTLNLSVGTTDSQRLAQMGRPNVLAAFDDCLGWAQVSGLTAVGYIIGAGPHQYAADTLEDLLYLALRRVLVGMSIFYPAPGSHDYEVCRKLGVLPASTALMRSSTLPIVHTTSRLEAFTLLKLSRMVNALKEMVDGGQPLPPARPYNPQGRFTDPPDRMELGQRLLSWFRHDGVFRGVSHRGDVFELPTDSTLTDRFRRFLDTHTIQGTQ